MSDTIIQVQNIGKKYIIRHQTKERYLALRDVIAKKVFSVGRRIFQPSGKWPTNRCQEEFWALKNVSFEVKQGEVLGIIGRNGAGKSTLLKILSRITEPTTGRVCLRGRVASLLEVGTGFHPELTGRENIFLNGAILGMSKIEIKRKFDEIVTFSEIEKFLDTPVKRYSSGMYVRLAFSVAAHLEPEILIVDEVLAVGDAIFQKKCLGKMNSISKSGRTVLFVSHNMAAISSLCSKAFILNNGKLASPVSEVNQAINLYLEQINNLTVTDLTDRSDRQGEGNIRIKNFQILDQNGNEQEISISGQFVEFRVFFQSSEELNYNNVTAGISIYSQEGAHITTLSNYLTSETFGAIKKNGYFSCKLDKLQLSPGSYPVNLIIRTSNQIQDWIQEAIILRVESGDYYGTGMLPPQSHQGVLLEQKWDHTSLV